MNHYPQQQLTLGNSTIISYIDSGPKDGPVILFVHGLGTYAQSWSKNIDVLSLKYRCLAIDLPGHGYSTAYKGTYSMHFFAECVLHFIGAMKLRHVTLAGHSMGAQVCIHAVLLAPDAAEKIALIAPAGFERFTPTEAMLYRNGLQYAELFGDDSHHLKHLLRNSFASYPKEADAMLAELLKLQRKAAPADYRKMIRQCMSAMLEEPVYEQLPQLKQQALIIFGERDSFIPNRLIHHLTTAKLAKHVQGRMQRAELSLIADAGHFVQWERSDNVNAGISKFMQQGYK